ncbi:hypothetical protein DV736_g2623, partial [Chaetothyriales sp. CBS 134916]
MDEDCANPLLVGWLKERVDAAREHNSKGYQTYKKAYQSMKSAPISFSHPSEAVVLNGIGEKLCAWLTERLQKYCTENGVPMPKKKRSSKRPTEEAERSETQSSPPKRARKAQPYVPKLRSGAYALLVALGTLNREQGQALSKTDLIPLAQPYSDSSFTAPTDPTKFFTAWNSMKTLESKELVCTKGHPTKRYYLSDEGWEVALRIREHGEATSSQANVGRKKVAADAAPAASEVEVFDLCSSPEASPSMQPLRRRAVRANTLVSGKSLRTTTNTIVLPPGSFDVRLVLDNREIRTSTDRDYVSQELKKLGVSPITRSLPLGDMVWIAQVKPDFADALQQLNIDDDEEGNAEVVLEHIVERKRRDDFISSIKDGRFHEQKFRLRKSGIKHAIYLIEDYSIAAEHAEKYGESMETAIKQLQVVYDVFVQLTTKLDDTVRYLARMTQQLQARYRNREIHVMRSNRLETQNYLQMLSNLREISPEAVFGTTFSAFSAMCDKNDSMTLRDVYIRMLLCIRGVTAERAVEISKIWKTPVELVEAFERQPDQKARDNMVSDRLGDAIPRKKVSKVLSATIAETRANGSVFGHAGSASLSGDFFTDSLLDDTSRIPSPTAPGQNDNVTPPQSANASGEFKTSTNSDLSTPPRALTEVYQRIDDEEELAAAEREDRSSEGGSDRHLALPLDAADTSLAAKSREVDTQLSGTLSEGTGMSFLKGLTDQNIARSITPAVSSHFKDMRKLGISTKPIAFNPGIKPSERLADLDDGDEGMGWTKLLPAEAQKLFPLGGRLNGHDVGKAQSDNSIGDRTKQPSQAFQLPLLSSQQPADQRLDSGAGGDDGDDGDDGYSTDEDLRKREVLFKFSQFAKKMNSKSSQAGSDEIGGRQTPRPEKASTNDGEERQDQNDGQRQRSSDGQPQHQRAPSLTSQASSSVNWAGIEEEMRAGSIEPAANKALPTSPPRSEASASIRSPSSTGRLKRWDNDFTGVSFQVSESPPVKSRAKVEDYVRQSAAARLSKAAVTRGRLDAIGERDGREARMRLSRSTSDDAASRTEAKTEELTIDTHLKLVGEQVPDTPVVIFRSSTSSQIDTPKADAEQPAAHGRSTSDDLIQRLARLGSSTPNHSPEVLKEDITEGVTEAGADEGGKDDLPADLSKEEEDKVFHNQPASKTTTKKKPIVAATPRVTGAWTDTILPDPDTIKTVKSLGQQQPQPSSYVQTPHVKAGGWVDTPLPRRHGQTSAAMAPIEDVTEELDTNVVPVVKAATDVREQTGTQSQSQSNGPAETVAQPRPPPLPVVPKSAWASIRDQQKQRSDNAAAAAVTDTLVLGNDTLASLDSVLDKTWRSADDLIKLSSSTPATAEQDVVASSEADTKQLELLLLGTLQTLQSNIHSARQGISKLEQEVARDVIAATAASAASSSSTTLLDLLARLPQDGKNKIKTKDKTRHNYTVFLLLALGLIGCWYLLECTLAEVMAHPLVAERRRHAAPHRPGAAIAVAALAWRRQQQRRRGSMDGGRIRINHALFAATSRVPRRGDCMRLDGWKMAETIVATTTTSAAAAEDGSVFFGMDNDEFM